MKNFVQTGDMVTVPAPYGLSSGMAVLVGSLFGVAACNAALGTSVDIKRKGVFDIMALTTDVADVGTKMYWDNTNKRVTTSSAGNTLVGCLTVAKGSSDATARVLLDGVVR